MTDCEVTSKKVFMENAEQVYSLLKNNPNVSMHIEAHTFRKGAVLVKYWVYSYKYGKGRYMLPGGDLKTCLKNIQLPD